jgi:hypothetical protein
VQFSSSNLKLEQVRISVSTCSLEASTFILQNRTSFADEERISSPSNGHLLPSPTAVSKLEAGEASVFVGLHNMGQGFGNLHGVLLEHCSRGVGVTHGFEEAVSVSSLPTGPNTCFSGAGKCTGRKVQRAVITSAPR